MFQNFKKLIYRPSFLFTPLFVVKSSVTFSGFPPSLENEKEFFFIKNAVPDRDQAGR